jgi:hypothetical protein
MTAIKNISMYKMQYRDVLTEGGFVQRSMSTGFSSRPLANKHDAPMLFVDQTPSSDPALVFDAHLLRGVVGSGLYPNFGFCDVSDGKGVKKLLTKAQGEVSIDPHSVVRKADVSLSEGLYAFDDLVSLESKAPHASRVTQVSLWSLLLLGAGPDSVKYFEGKNLASLDGWFYFECAPNAHEALVKLKQCLTYRIDRLIRAPSDDDNRERFTSIGSIIGELLKVPSSPANPLLTMSESNVHHRKGNKQHRNRWFQSDETSGNTASPHGKTSHHRFGASVEQQPSGTVGVQSMLSNSARKSRWNEL